MKKIILSILAIAICSSTYAQSEVSPLQFMNNERGTEVAKEGTHIVQKGETLSSIGRLYGTSFRNIQLINNLPDETIKVGQVLKVPTTGTATNARGAGERKAVSNEGLLYAKKQLKHTVQAGDDIYSISDTYGVSVDEIRRLNDYGSSIVNFNIGEQVIYKEAYEAASSEKAVARAIPEKTQRVSAPVSTEPTVTVESDPLSVTPPPAIKPKRETIIAANPAVPSTVETLETGERRERGGYIGVEDANQKDPYYIYHKTLKTGTKVRLHIPDNAGYVVATVVNRIDTKRKEIIGISPACLRLIGGKANPTVTITYLP